MSLKTALLIEGNAAGAQKAVRETKTALDDMAGSTGKVAVAGKVAGAQVGKTAKATEALGKSNTLAAGQVGNLTAQFNDIGMMLMAGQNPLQLAIQQGTQITQVIGPMGATGAVRALGTAFMGMINPVSVVTIGAIAAGAAMVNWLTDARGKTATLEDAIGRAGEAIKAFRDQADRARLSTSGMLDEFGAASPELRAVLADLAALGKIKAYQEIDRTAESIRKLVSTEDYAPSRRSDTMDFLGLKSTRIAARQAGAEFDRLLVTLRDSQEPAAKLKAALDLREQLLSTAGGIDGLSVSQQEFYQGLAAVIRDLTVLGAKTAEMASGVSARQEASGRDMLANLIEENNIRAAIASYGEESLEVTALRQEAERRAFEETLATMEVSEELKDELRAAFDNGQLLANLDIASGLDPAVAKAQALAEMLGLAVTEAMSLMNLRDSMQYSGRGGDPRTQGGDFSDWQDRPQFTPPSWTPDPPEYRTAGTGGGRSQLDAIQRLLERERERLAILRETDPVQKELLRNSRYLADATDGERAALEALIATRIAEEEQLDILQQKRDFFADTTYDALSGLILQGNSLRDVMANVAMAIADAALQAALLGKGPFAGGGGGGGLLGFVGDLLFPKFAGGGLIYGPGDGRSDDVPILASSGEFMMNAVATKRYRHVLEAMNSGGALPGFAQGGMIGGSASPRPSMPGAGVQAIEMNVNVSGANGNREIEQMVYQGVERALTQYDREILPIRIRQIESNGRRVG